MPTRRAVSPAQSKTGTCRRASPATATGARRPSRSSIETGHPVPRHPGKGPPRGAPAWILCGRRSPGHRKFARPRQARARQANFPPAVTSGEAGTMALSFRRSIGRRRSSRSSRSCHLARVQATYRQTLRLQCGRIAQLAAQKIEQSVAIGAHRRTRRHHHAVAARCARTDATAAIDRGRAARADRAPARPPCRIPALWPCGWS